MNPNDTFSEAIVKEIEARGAVPRSRWYFLASRSMFWILAGASFLVGSTAFAIADFVFIDNDGITKLHGSSIQDIAQTIPFLWLAIMAMFTLSTYYSFRYTRKGYKYATFTIVVMVVLLSVGTGILLNSLDFGQQAYSYLNSFYTGAPLIHEGAD